MTDNDKARVTDINRHIGLRIRDYRMTLGVSGSQLAKLIGITQQQAHKYERGLAQISAGRLYDIAWALEVEPDFFFEGMDDEAAAGLTGRRRALLELVRHFRSIADPDHRQAVVTLARTLAEER